MIHFLFCLRAAALQRWVLCSVFAFVDGCVRKMSKFYAMIRLNSQSKWMARSQHRDAPIFLFNFSLFSFVRCSAAKSNSHSERVWMTKQNYACNFFFSSFVLSSLLFCRVIKHWMEETKKERLFTCECENWHNDTAHTQTLHSGPRKINSNGSVSIWFTWNYRPAKRIIIIAKTVVAVSGNIYLAWLCILHTIFVCCCLRLSSIRFHGNLL